MIPVPMTYMLFWKRLFKNWLVTCFYSAIFKCDILNKRQVNLYRSPMQSIPKQYGLSLDSQCPKIFLANKHLCRARIGKILLCCQQQQRGGGSSHSKPSARNRGFFQPCCFLVFRDQSYQFTSRIFFRRTQRVAKKQEQKSRFWQLMQCGSALITCFYAQNCEVLKQRKKKINPSNF